MNMECVLRQTYEIKDRWALGDVGWVGVVVVLWVGE